ncbi:MAG: DNA-formamidopyrimidine glycosylase [Candidatus Cloacimonadaceae bacterium]|jgi:formamidopyrimidine-DNA glycosylase
MPELPEVQTVLGGVIQKLGSKQITGLECYYPGTVINRLSPQDQPFPAKLRQGYRRGKYMILELTSGFALIIHLRMTGKLVWDKDDGEPKAHERAAILVSGGNRLRFIDIRTFGKITLLPGNQVHEALPNLGAEPLQQGFGAAYLSARLAKSKRPIKTALLDQSIVAGLGNIYVCEILYEAGVNPFKLCNQLNEEDFAKIAAATKLILAQALMHNGTSISDFRRVDDKAGSFQNFLKVYQKEHCPQGHEVQKIKQAGRSTYLCPVCQK